MKNIFILSTKNIRIGSILALCFFLLAACESDEGNLLPPDEQLALDQDNQKDHSSARMQQTVFTAHLSGQEEVPPVETKATGQATFKLSSDGTELHYKLIAANIENVLQSHIHLAPAGVNGGVVVWLYPSAPPATLIPGMFQGVLAEGTITDANLVGALAGQTLSDLLDHMRSGNAYVNIHTSAHGPGEIRGQIK